MNQVRLLHRASLAIHSARQDADMLRQLSTCSFDAKKFKEGEKLCDDVRSFTAQQEEARRQAKGATKTLRETRAHIHTRYMYHLSLARTVFKTNDKAQDELGLKGVRSSRLENWLKQTRDFYRNALSYAETLEQYGIPRHEMEESQILLGQMIELLSLQKQTLSRAQVLTQKKQELLVQLEQWYRKLIKLARIALEDSPQQMEALGIKVKTKA